MKYRNILSVIPGLVACCLLCGACRAQETSASYVHPGSPSLVVDKAVSGETAAVSQSPTVATGAETVLVQIGTETSIVGFTSLPESPSVKAGTVVISAKALSDSPAAAVGETIPAAAETVTLGETEIPPPPPYIARVHPGLALMPTSYTRMSPRHTGENGINSDFLFGCYIGELYHYVDERHSFFDRWYLFLFGLDTKWSFTIGKLLSGVGFLYGKEKEMKRFCELIDAFDPDSYDNENMYLPTIGVGVRNWLFTSMGTSMELTGLFSDSDWITDYYVICSKKIGDCGVHVGYVYGDFTARFKDKISAMNRDLRWIGGGESHTLFVGFDMPSFLDKKTRLSFECMFVNKDSFILNTTFPGIWGFEFGLLKVPRGFAVLGYWSFRSNLFTANGPEDALKF